MSNITIAAAHSLDELNTHGPAVTWEDFETIKKAKDRAQYVLTREYANAAEMSEPFGYSQVIVDGEVHSDFFSKEVAKPVTGKPTPPPPTELEIHTAALAEIQNHLNIYRVGLPDESVKLPYAIFTNQAELRALAFFIKTLPKAVGLLAQAVDYIESSDAHHGHYYSADQLRAAIESGPRRYSDISTGRDGMTQTRFEIGKARAITGQPGYQDSR